MRKLINLITVKYLNMFEADAGIEFLGELKYILEPLKKSSTAQKDTNNKNDEKIDDSLNEEVSELKKKIQDLEKEKNELEKKYEEKIKFGTSKYEINEEIKEDSIQLLEDRIKVLEYQKKLVSGLGDLPEEQRQKEKIEKELSESKLELLKNLRAKDEPLDQYNIRYKISNKDYKEKMDRDKELLDIEKEYVKKNPFKNPILIRNYVFEKVRKSQLKDAMPNSSDEEIDVAYNNHMKNKNSPISIIIGDNARHREILKNIRLNIIYDRLKEKFDSDKIDDEQIQDAAFNKYEGLEKKWIDENQNFGS